MALLSEIDNPSRALHHSAASARTHNAAIAEDFQDKGKISDSIEEIGFRKLSILSLRF